MGSFYMELYVEISALVRSCLLFIEGIKFRESKQRCYSSWHKICRRRNNRYRLNVMYKMNKRYKKSIGAVAVRGRERIRGKRAAEKSRMCGWL